MKKIRKLFCVIFAFLIGIFVVFSSIVLISAEFGFSGELRTWRTKAFGSDRERLIINQKNQQKIERKLFHIKNEKKLFCNVEAMILWIKHGMIFSADS